MTVGPQADGVGFTSGGTNYASNLELGQELVRKILCDMTIRDLTWHGAILPIPIVSLASLVSATLVFVLMSAKGVNTPG